MAIALVQKLGTKTQSTNVASTSITVTGSTTAGNHILVAVVCHATDPTVSATDSKSNTYQLDKHVTLGSGSGPFVSILSSHTATGLVANTDTINLTFTGGTANAEILAYEYSGLATSSWVDVTGGTTGSGNSVSSGAFTTTNANDLLFGCVAWENGSASSATGWTKLDEADAFLTSKSALTQYSIISSAGSQTETATVTLAPAWTVAAVAYKAGSASPPSNTVAPAVTGTATVGSTLTTTNGTWTDNGSPVFTYQWQRDAAGNGVYSNIASATASTYVLVSADDTCHVRCVVTDTDALSLSGSANSNATAIVTFAVPVNSVAPVVSGNTVVGSVLSTTNGTWSNSPASFGYQWTRDGVNISAATSSTYTSVSADATHAVGCTVTATNDGGTSSGVASSNTISVVTAPSLSTVAGKTGTSGTAVMQKAKSGWTYITGKKNTSGTAVDQKGLGGFTKIKGH